jgi:hypothetical protein
MGACDDLFLIMGWMYSSVSPPRSSAFTGSIEGIKRFIHVLKSGRLSQCGIYNTFSSNGSRLHVNEHRIKRRCAVFWRGIRPY